MAPEGDGQGTSSRGDEPTLLEGILLAVSTNAVHSCSPQASCTVSQSPGSRVSCDVPPVEEKARRRQWGRAPQPSQGGIAMAQWESVEDQGLFPHLLRLPC